MAKHKIIFPLVLGLFGCPETGVNAVVDKVDPLDQVKEACIEVSPKRLIFDEVDISNDEFEASGRVTISNVCEGKLEINSINIEGTNDINFKFANLEDVLLDQGEVTDLEVTFRPLTAGDYKAVLKVTSNDENNPEVRVQLIGEALSPIIDVTPEEYDYGAPYIGCESTSQMTIRNLGNTDLILSDVELFTATQEEYSLDLDPLTNGNLPFYIGPYDSTQGGPTVDIWVDYLPLDTFADTGFATFYSNDPLLPEKITLVDGSGVKYGDNLDIFEQPVRSETDIIFTLDRSCSMRAENESVIANFDVFIETLTGLDADFHTAVVVGDDGCVAGPDPFVDNTFSATAAKEIFGTMADLDFSLKPYGSNTERGFMLAEAALSTKNTGAGGCNSELYREDAFLSLVHVSDEPEQSVNSWSYYVALFQSLKSDPDDVVINAVAGDYPSGCSGTGTSASPGTGYYEGTVATGGLFLSICSSDWAKSLEDIATESVAINDSFELTRIPVPQTIEVKLDGIRLSVGWEYNITSNSIVFDRDFIPAGGSVIEVYYDVMPDCEG